MKKIRLFEYGDFTSHAGKELPFNEVDDAKLSTIDQFSAADQHKELRKSGNQYMVSTISLNDLLKRYNAPILIDYLSIDTEGSEFEILKNFDFKKQQVEIFTIEHNFLVGKRDKIFKIMTENDYKRVFENLSHWDDWYVRKDNTVLKSMIDYK